MIFGVHKYFDPPKWGRDIRRRQRGLPQLLTARRAKDLDVTEFMRVVTHRLAPPAAGLIHAAYGSSKRKGRRNLIARV